MTDLEKELSEWFFNLLGYFNHYSFFTEKLWRDVKGFENKDEAEIKAVFMHYWFHNKFGYYTCPCGCSWFAELSKECYESYIGEYIPIFKAFENWCREQR